MSRVAEQDRQDGPPAPGALPAGFRVELDPGVRALDDGAVLCGGAPLRLLRLTDGGRRLVERLARGGDVPPTGGAQRLVRRLLDAGMAHPVPPPATLTAADVTVVVPTVDRADELDRTLRAIGEVGRVIVVDDGSADSEITEAVTREHRVELVRHDRSLGPGVARDTGWGLADTEVVAFVDADCEPEAGWLVPLLAHFADPTVAAVAPRIATRAGPGWLASYEAARSPLDMGPRLGPVRPRSWVPYVPTATLVARRSALAAVGGFDRALRYGEDVDLVWRLGEAGWTVRYEPAVTVHHPPRASAAAWARQRFAYGTSAAALARRHGRAVAPLVVSVWSALAWLLAGLGFRKTAVAVAAGTTALLVPRLRALEHPVPEAARLAGLGHLYAGRAVADALRRPWWPIAAVAALVSRRSRRGLALAVAVPPLLEWQARRPALDPARWCAARLVDDLSYGAGVWVGCIRERSGAALVPDLAAWPGHRAAVEAG